MSSKIKCAVFIVSIILLLTLFSVRPALARDDWGLASETIIKYKINKRLSMIIFPYLQWRDDLEDFSYTQNRLGLKYKAYDFLELATYYHYSELQSSSTGKWSSEHRALFDGILKWKMLGLKCSNRSRMEIRFIGEDEKLRYRDEFIIQKPVRVFGIDLVPFVSNEIFYDLKADRAQFNWFTVGCSKKINKNLILGLAYKLESTKETGGGWSGLNNILIRTIILF